jgi:hypothetical protein
MSLRFLGASASVAVLLAGQPRVCRADDDPNDMHDVELGSAPNRRASADDDVHDPRTWTFGARAAPGLAVFDKANICLDGTSSSCPNDVWGYAVSTVEAEASLGRRSSRARWLTALNVTYGLPLTTDAGHYWGVRLVTGLRFLTAPESTSSFVLEVAGGATYYAVAHGGTEASGYASAPMLSVSVGMGSRIGQLDLLARANLDTILFESVGSGQLVLGYTF